MGAMQVLGLVPSPTLVDGSQLRLHVIYTTPEETRASLDIATLLAKDLGARLELLVPHVVPYPLPLHGPAISTRFTEKSLRALVGRRDVDVDVKVLLCRDREETIATRLPSESIAVIGRRRRWGPGSSRGLIRAVRRGGHHVIVVDGDKSQPAAAPLCRRRIGR